MFSAVGLLTGGLVLRLGLGELLVFGVPGIPELPCKLSPDEAFCKKPPLSSGVNEARGVSRAPHGTPDSFFTSAVVGNLEVVALNMVCRSQ